MNVFIYITQFYPERTLLRSDVHFTACTIVVPVLK